MPIPKQKNYSHSNNSISNRPLIYGEVLYDQFEDSSTLGGAPFNVAWHLQGFGLNPLFITRIGDDKEGHNILVKMKEWGISTDGIQIDSSYPTGKVIIGLEDGQPSFDILADQAYDYIDYNVIEKIIDNHNFTMLYHGSLIMRNTASRDALTKLAQQLQLPTFIDINLRAPWWNNNNVDSAFSNAAQVKLNNVELGEILNTKFLIKKHQIEQYAQALLEKVDLKLLIITLGADGAFFVTKQNSIYKKSVSVENLQDTVGAGDAFSAVTILGLLSGWSTENIIDRAMKFSAAICSIRGATSTDLNLYKTHVEEWLE